MSAALPLCRWRGPEVGPGHYGCGSPKLIVGSEGVTAENCGRCYCPDHPPVPVFVSGKVCNHLGRRIRTEEGSVKVSICEPCGGKSLDLYQCGHPATADAVTLADCKECQYRPGISPMIDRVYLINLRRRTDRLAAFRARQISHGWKLPPVEVWPAVDGDMVGVPGYYKEGGGAWGCLRSHIGILEKCLMDGVNSVMVLEDDAEWFKDTWDRLGAFLAAVPADWSQLMLGGQHLQPPSPIAEGVVRCRNTQRTHAYVLRGSAIKSLLKAWYTAAVHLDWVMGGDWQRGWPVYSPDPFLFGQSGGKSDVSGRLNNALYWNPPTNAAVVHLVAAPKVAAILRSHGLHTGFRRDAEGYDIGLTAAVAEGGPSDKLSSWLATILWEVASMEGRVATAWHPGVTRVQLERIHAGEIRSVTAETVEDGLRQLEGLPLLRCYASTHILLLHAPRAVVEQLSGFHRGYWLDPVSGVDQGQLAAAAGDPVLGLRKWLYHTGEEAERSQTVPLVWCPGLLLSDVRAAFPNRTVVSIAQPTVALIERDWSLNVL